MPCEKEEDTMKIKKLEKDDELTYLNGFKIHYETKSGSDKVWELVSRGDFERLEKELMDHESFTDGAMVFATDEAKEKVVILKEYRVSAGKYMYMFPAGLVEFGEDIMDAAAREFKEETGLTLFPKMVEKERYVSVGIVNEKVNVVYGTFEGTPSKKYQEDSEDADIFIICREDAVRILKEEEVSIRTAMLLQAFYKIHPFFDGE